MKTIKRKISTPFIIVIFMIPFMFMILFNAAMNVYLEKTAREELKNNIAGIEILIRQQLMEDASTSLQKNSDASANQKLTELQEELRRSKLSLLYNVKNMNIEFLLVSPKGEVLFPKSFHGSFLSNRLVLSARSELNGIQEDTIKKFRFGGKKYYTVYQSLTDSPDSTQLLFISSGSSAKSIVRIVNLILFSITVLAVAISSVIALIISKSISKPITRLTGYAKRIGNSEFLTLTEDKSSVEIHELTQSMNEMSSRLKAFDSAQKSFLQNASHELRTPLMSIQGYAEGIMQGVFTDPVKTAAIICEESRRLNTLVEELLTLSRIENKNYRGDLISINLTDVLREYVQRINGYALKAGKTVTLNISEDTITVRADDSLLSQAVLNIISNCIKYAVKEATVSLYIDNNQAVIRISDDGSGISSIDLPHIFERFYKGKKGDFGLGLSIAKSAVEFMNGEITAYNSDTGAVFEIRLPLI